MVLKYSYFHHKLELEILKIMNFRIGVVRTIIFLQIINNSILIIILLIQIII